MDKHPLADKIDRGYVCAQAEKAAKSETGGLVISTALLDMILQKASESTTESHTVPASLFVGFLQRIMHAAIQNGQPVALSSSELRAIASLMDAPPSAPDAAVANLHDNVITFPVAPQQFQAPIRAESA